MGQIERSAIRDPHLLSEWVRAGKLTRRRLLRMFGVSATAFALRPRTVLGADDYDYVVVGAGAAGRTLCARLLADSNARVLLIEAGGSNERR